MEKHTCTNCGNETKQIGETGRLIQFQTSEGNSGVRSEKIYQCPYCKTVVIY